MSMKAINERLYTPKYVQLKGILAETIKVKKSDLGEEFLSENQLMKKYNLSCTTVRKAITELVQEGLLYRIQGKGTFVAGRRAVGPKRIFRRTNALEIILPWRANNLADFYTLRLIEGITEALSNTNCNLLIRGRSSKSRKRLSYKQILRDGQIDGLMIVAPREEDREDILKLKEIGIPFILLSGYLEGEKVNYVDSDNRRGAFRAVEHLINLGHKRIGLLHGSFRFNTTDSRDRLRGYKLALERQGVCFNEELVAGGGNSDYRAINKLLDMRPPPSGIFAIGLSLAVKAVKTIKARGLKVPDDISVIGFDDYELAISNEPPLTTVRQPVYEIGWVGTKKLFDIIAGKEKGPVEVILKTKLVVRKSCRKRVLRQVRSA